MAADSNSRENKYGQNTKKGNAKDKENQPIIE